MKGILAGVRLRRVFLLAGLVFGLVFAAIPAGSALAATKTFTAQGCGNTVPANVFTVPAGVTSVTITATASAGQTSTGAVTLFPGVGMPGPGGSGDVMSGTLSGLGSGQILDVCVDSGGGAGGSGDSGSVQNGATGGGASGVALGSNFLTPVLIAAGGGGGGTENGGGGAGLPNGGAGVGCSGDADLCHGGGAGGGGGTQSTFGTGGAVDPTCTCSATAGPGANGAASSSAGPGTGGAGGGDGTVWGGGGGGAGHFGGGGGGAANSEAGGGGGGSDFCASSLTGATLSDCTVTGTNSMFGTASVTISYTAPRVCSGTLSAPGVLKGAYPDGMTVEGVCEVNDGKAHVTGTLTVTKGSVLGAAFGAHHSRLAVSGNLVVEKGAVVILGCKSNPNGTGMACLDDPNPSAPTLRSHASVSGNIIDNSALAMIVHNSAIGESIKDIGGGGGASCAVPTTGIFAAIKSPVFSDLEDSTVGGDIRMNGLRTCWFGLARDTVHSYVTININKTADPDAIEVLANHIGASLSCWNNRHPGAQPKGTLPIWDSADAPPKFKVYPRVSEPNTVGGSRSGQCVKASPIKLGGPPAAKKF